MSFKLAQGWVVGAFRELRGALDALNLFERASVEGIEATLLMAPELMNNGICCLAHWTGQELVVLELSPRQQRAFGIEPGMMLRELEPQQKPREPPTIQQVSLSDVSIDNQLQHDDRKPLTGKFTFEAGSPNSGPISGCALRVKYFHPQMKRRITGFSHAKVMPAGGEMPFSFDPLVSAHNPDSPPGPLVLFFQLVIARDWSTLEGRQRISNVLARVIDVV